MHLQQTEQGIKCTIDLDNGRQVVASGKSEPDLLVSLMSELAEVTPNVHADKESQQTSVSLAKSVYAQTLVLEPLMQHTYSEPNKAKRSESTRLQIGLTTKVSLHQVVKEVADRRAVPVATVARDLLQDGLVRFDKASQTISPSVLLAEYERRANDYAGTESENWIIRADRRLVMKTRLRAGEYGRSLSSFANFILADALIHCPEANPVLSSAIGVVFSDDAIENALQIILQNSGVKARNLASQIGLGEHRALTNMILSGTVQAPARVLTKIGKALKLPLDVLSVALERRFANQAVPAFKATKSKPNVHIERKSWGTAVRELQLPTDEQERLLKLEG